MITLIPNDVQLFPRMEQKQHVGGWRCKCKPKFTVMYTPHGHDVQMVVVEHFGKGEPRR